MRILHISTFLQGGAGRAITDLALAQHALGHEVSVAVDARGELGYDNYPEYLGRLELAGLQVHRLDSTFKRDLTKNLAAVQDLLSSGAVENLDLVHAHAAIPSFVAR